MANNNKHTGPNVPALRFPEFSGEWESCTLGDITNNFSRRNKDRIQYPMFSVTNNRGFVPQSEQFEDREMVGEDIQAYKVIEKGDFAYNPARINVGSIAKYEGNGKCMISSLYVCFNTIDRIDRDWFMHLLKTPKMNFYYNLNGEGGVRVYLFYPNFARIRSSYPSLAEQKKIAAMLSLIDERIATQSKIIEELNTLRSALIDKYISDGYGQDGVQDIVTLGDNGVFIRGLSYSSSDVTDHVEMTGVIRSNNLESGHPVDTDTDVVFVRKKPSKEQQLVCGDIVICMANGSSALVGKASQYQAMKDNMTVGAFCGIYRGTHPLTKWIFMSSTYSKAVANAIQGGNGAIANLHGEDVLAMRFAIPRDCSDVKRLFELFSACDAKIIGAERILAQYRLQKRFLMQKMFI